MVISIINQKGGCGKSTLAVHLAVWLYERGRNVIVVDADNQTASFDWLERAAPELGCHAALEPAEIERAVTILKPNVDFIIADGPPGLDGRAQTLARLSDLIVMPTNPAPMDLRATVQASKTFEQMGLRGRLLMVLNRRKKGALLTRMTEDAFTALDYPMARAQIGDREAVKDAQRVGSVVWKMKGTGPAQAAAEFHALFTEILPHVREQRDEVDGGAAAAGDGARPAAADRARGVQDGAAEAA